MLVKRKVFVMVVFLMIASLLLAACGPNNTNAAENEADTQEEASAEEADTEEEAEVEEGDASEDAEDATEEEADVEEEAETVPAVGGNFVWAMTAEPDTLDCQKTASGLSSLVCGYISASLVIKDPETSEIIPWLAESWEVSEDGLTVTFQIRQNVLFHDGTPMTASDLAFTFNRAMDPETASPGTASMLGALESAEAVDDYTLVFHLAAPNALLFENLIESGYMMVYSEDYVNANDAEYLTRNPMSVGPFIFEEWVTGDHITLKRNPDYNWGPEYAPGANMIEKITFMFIPEESTILAGIEAGEIDLYSTNSPAVIDQVKEFDNIYLKEALDFSVQAVLINTSMPTIQNLEIRQAMNYAVDRQAIIDVILNGYGVPAYGPFSAAVYGYDTTLEETGYGYNPEKAKELIESLGYTLNEDGIYEMDGETLSFELNTMDQTATSTKLAEILQQQYKDVGIEVEIQILEFGVAIQNLLSSQFEMGIMNFGMPNASILNLIFSQYSMGGAIFAGLDTADLEEMLTGVQTIVDPDAWLENVHAAQQKIVEAAMFVPIYHQTSYIIVNNDFQNVDFTIESRIVLENAYYVGE